MNFTIPKPALDKYYYDLNQISKVAFPNAIRQTLNTAAFDVKKNTMLKTSKLFVQRRPTFFKSNSAVDMAKGNDISNMSSKVGFRSRNDGKGHSVEDLEQQEHGGKIKDRDYIATPLSRANNSWEKNVRTGLKMKDLKSKLYDSNLIDVHKVKTRFYSSTQKRNYERNGLKGQLSKKQKFIRASIMAVKLNKFIIGNKKQNGRTISRIDSFTKSKDGRISIKRTALYTYNKGRVVPIKATNFMKRASLESALNLNKWFIANAERQIEKNVFK